MVITDNPLKGVKFTESEKKFSLKMMKSWTEFIKTGNPSNSNFNWEEFKNSNSYLKMDESSMKMTKMTDYDQQVEIFYESSVRPYLS